VMYPTRARANKPADVLRRHEAHRMVHLDLNQFAHAIKGPNLLT
jgi:hypothetical protein